MKKTDPRYLVALGAALAAMTLGGSAAADPVAAYRLPARSFAELRQDVARARAADPRPFAVVTDMISLAPEANARARARRAPIALYLARLGPSALLPILEKLAIDPPRGVPDDAAPLVRRDLIEAVGLLHDARGLPVLSAILEDASEDVETTRTTAEAIARIGTPDAAAKILTELGAAKPDRARAIVAGMGECRRFEITEALGERLRTATDDATALAATRSLGRAGNAWAWRASADRADETRIRSAAARALVAAFVARRGEAREAAAKALLVVDAPESTALIAEARRGATPETVTALDGLASRLARSPLHR